MKIFKKSTNFLIFFHLFPLALALIPHKFRTFSSYLTYIFLFQIALCNVFRPPCGEPIGYGTNVRRLHPPKPNLRVSVRRAPGSRCWFRIFFLGPGPVLTVVMLKSENFSYRYRSYFLVFIDNYR